MTHMEENTLRTGAKELVHQEEVKASKARISTTLTWGPLTKYSKISSEARILLPIFSMMKTIFLINRLEAHILSKWVLEMEWVWTVKWEWEETDKNRDKEILSPTLEWGEWEEWDSTTTISSVEVLEAAWEVWWWAITVIWEEAISHLSSQAASGWEAVEWENLSVNKQS